MLAPLALPAVAGLLAVTFGWVPSAETADTPSASTDGYDYLVKVSPEDLEAMRSGEPVAITSELPDGIGPISRVRVYAGRGDAPRRLTATDRRSPKQIATDAAPKRYTVAKPVAPEWRDASDIGSDPQAGAQRREAFQNPNGFNDLSADFREAAANTQRATEQLVNDLGRGTEEAFRGVGESLEKVSPFATRPQYPPQNAMSQAGAASNAASPNAGQGYAGQDYPGQRYPGQPTRVQPTQVQQPGGQQYSGQQYVGQPRAPYPPNTTRASAPASQRVDPPQPTRRFTDTRVAQQTPPFREPGVVGAADAGRSAGGRGPDFPSEDWRADGITTQFGADDNYGAPTGRPMRRIERDDPQSVDVARPTADELYEEERWRQQKLAEFRRESERLRKSASRSASDSRRSGTRPVSMDSRTRGAGDSLADGDLGVESALWPGGDFADDGADGRNAAADDTASDTTTATSSDSNRNLQTLLMVFALFAAGYVWVTHMELRAKYRALLRGGPGGYSSAA